VRDVTRYYNYHVLFFFYYHTLYTLFTTYAGSNDKNGSTEFAFCLTLVSRSVLLSLSIWNWTLMAAETYYRLSRKEADLNFLWTCWEVAAEHNNSAAFDQLFLSDWNKFKINILTHSIRFLRILATRLKSSLCKSHCWRYPSEYLFTYDTRDIESIILDARCWTVSSASARNSLRPQTV